MVGHAVRMAAVILPLLATPSHADELVVPGSGNPQYVLSLLADAFNQRQTAHRVSIPPTSGTAGAIRDVESGAAVLGRVGRPLTEAERARGLVYVPMGRDPVTFVGGADVTMRTLSSQQILDIYTGRITQWQQVGGSPGPIRVIGREVTDASRQAVINALPQFGTIMFDERVKIAHLDSQMLEMLDRFPTSLGFLNRSSLNAARTRLVELALDGMKASADAAEPDTNCAWVEMGLIHKTGRTTPAAKAFMDFVLSPEGDALLSSQGLIVAARKPGLVR